MTETTFDLSTCTRCGLCVGVCPVRIIELDEEKYPFLPEEAKVRCVRCGHCEAVCPVHAANVHDDELATAPAAVRSAITPEQFAQYCMMRRSIRHYKKDPVDRSTIEKLLDIARYAPSGINRQPVEWVVLYHGDAVQNAARITIEWMKQTVLQNAAFATQMGMPNLIAGWDAGLDTICRNAPHCIIAHAQKDDRIAPTDGIIALSHIELAAPSLGLGACWAGYLHIAVNMYPLLKEAVGIPGEHVCIGGIMLGYPAESYVRIPKRKPAKVKWM